MPEDQTRQKLFTAATSILLLLIPALAFHNAESAPSVQTEPTAITEAPVTVPTEPPATVPLDTQPPILTGITDHTVYQNDVIMYRSGVAVSDDCDPSPVLSVDSSAVDLTQPGIYTVKYIAADASGNTSMQAATVEVLLKGENYISIEETNAKVAKLLDKILTEDNMTMEEQLRAIYNYMHKHFTYGLGTHGDLYQTTNAFLTTRVGDCYGYFSTVKLMLEQLGIPNIDVHKLKRFKEDSNHLWHLVSLDGGKTWYHYDTSPRNGSPNLCIVTDAQLDSFSKAKYNRDRSLYPATPEEPFVSGSGN